MDFRILGPLEVVDRGRQLPLGKPRTRAVLAAFLLHANEPLTRERVVDLVWGGSPPRTADAAFYNCVSDLRRALGADRLSGEGGAYRLVVGKGELDRDRFEALVADGHAALTDGAAERAASLLEGALATWRGDPLDEVRYETFAQPEIRRLEELHLTALETRIDADLACGRHEALVAELEGLVQTHSGRERFHAQLMLALYRSGRQADALGHYREARRVLLDELGLEPGAELQDLERKILRQSPALELLETGAPTGLPIPPTSIIGRSDELVELEALLHGGARFVTLVGPGGVGKTRLALELAASSSRRVVFVDLSPVSASEEVLPTVAHALGVREMGGQSLVEATEARVRALDDCLLVVDNCERVVEAAPRLAALVAACPKLQILATSREPLHVAAEHEYAVEPLLEEDAVSLFVERGRRMQSSFAPSAAAAALCRRLDCLPLALELAAARTNVLTVEQILERLGRRDDLLTVGARDAPARQKTLHAAIDWSYDLLDEDEKVLFSRLAVFAGGWSLEAAEAICGADLDALASLVDKNLVRRRADRFAMLETMREYATDLLEESGQAQQMRRLHLEYWLAQVERDDLVGIPPQVAALVAAEYDNLRAGLAWAVEAAPELALRLAAMLWSPWAARGMLAEGQRWLDDALGRTSSEPSALRGHALAGASRLAYLTGNPQSSKRLAHAALEVARAIDDSRMAVFALNALGAAATAVENYEQARRHYEEAATLARRCGDERGFSAAIGNLGTVAYVLGEWDEAIALYTEQLSLRPEWPESGFPLVNIALAELQAGQEPAAVAARYEDVFARATESGDALPAVIALWGLGLTAASAGCSDPAVHALGAASAQRDLLGYALEASDCALEEEVHARLRAQLGEDVFAAAWAVGGSLSPVDAATRAVESIRSASTARDTSSRP
jgi:predicted ATPase/DNA-binding SARP family transcriptional activator